MSLTFSELIIYLLPGFLGLWVFKKIVQEDINERAESTQIAIGLLLGLSGFCMLYLIHMVMSVISPELGELISPKALQVRECGGRIEFGNSVNFWISYLVLSISSLLSGAIWGLIAESRMNVVRMIANVINRNLKHPEKSSSESELRRLINLSLEKTKLVLVRIYPLSEGASKGKIGWLMGYSEQEKDITLSRVELFEVFPDINERLNKQPHDICVNYGTGMVIEIFNFEEEKMKRFEEGMRKKYQEKIQGESKVSPC